MEKISNNPNISLITFAFIDKTIIHGKIFVTKVKDGISMGELLKGKNILIMGVRNKWSIAWGIAKAAHDEGASLIFTYQGEREREGVGK
jgi:hypothetical protein